MVALISSGLEISGAFESWRALLRGAMISPKSGTAGVSYAVELQKGWNAGGGGQGWNRTNPILDRLRSFGQTRGLAFRAYGEASPDVHALLTVAADGARTQEEALVHRLLAAPAAGPRHLPRRHRIRRVPYIGGVPRAVVERRMQRGQLIGGPQARVPLLLTGTGTAVG